VGRCAGYETVPPDRTVNDHAGESLIRYHSNNELFRCSAATEFNLA
jgi:hypothetical protein